jgi:hypothetical protein
MASTITQDGIQALLRSAGVEGDIPPFPLADIETHPTSIYQSFLAGTLIKLASCEPEAAWDAIQWPNDLGDLTVIIPRLKLKRVDPAHHAVQLQQTVCII